MRRLKSRPGWLAASAWPVATALLVSAASPQGPLAAKVTVTSVAVYTGSSPLPKPQKILVYDFAVNADDVQVDKVQALRPRHLITGDKSSDQVAASAGKKYYVELVKALEKTGIPVEHVATGTVAPENAMVVQGSFTSLKEGTKAERDSICDGYRECGRTNQGGCEPQDTHRNCFAFPVSNRHLRSKGHRLRSPRGCRHEPSVRSGQIDRHRPQEDAQRLRFQNRGRHGERDFQGDGRTTLDQDQR